MSQPQAATVAPPTYPIAAPTFRQALGTAGFMAKITALLEWWQSTRVGRTLSRYSMQRGYLLAGGIAYTAIFSLFAALALGITIAMKVLSSSPSLQTALFHSIDQSMPGVLKLPGKEGGLVAPEDLILDSGLSLPGIIATVVLLFAALRVMAALKTSIRSMFGIVALPTNAAMEYVRDFLAFLALALSVLVTAVLGTITSTLGGSILDLLGMDSTASRVLLRATALVLAAAVDALVIWILVRFTAGVRVPKKDLLMGLALGAFGSGVLRFLGTSAVKVVDNPILASFAALVTVLLWVNLLGRVILQMSAFMANPPRPELPESAEHIHAAETPNYVTMSVPETLSWPHQRITGAIEPDPERHPKAPAPKVEQPVWGGIVGKVYQWRIRHAKRKVSRLEDAYYGRS